MKDWLGILLRDRVLAEHMWDLGFNFLTNIKE